ncbi:hypothetical protein GFC30_2744 [Anoxybacillus amylolyticus]|uniref:Uncharacterized protein n=1 Tax=Anoxybacteroides amylolyticum TaxID=294699 RepID=A0A160F434_9BACL|nr:hypothetical protein GFC30_2744 [Anoxybacillus amylolyticus]
MNFDILQAVLEIIFQRYMVYLTPVLFLFIVIMFGERLISFLYNVIRR